MASAADLRAFEASDEADESLTEVVSKEVSDAFAEGDESLTDVVSQGEAPSIASDEDDSLTEVVDDDEAPTIVVATREGGDA